MSTGSLGVQALARPTEGRPGKAVRDCGVEQPGDPEQPAKVPARSPSSDVAPTQTYAFGVVTGRVTTGPSLPSGGRLDRFIGAGRGLAYRRLLLEVPPPFIRILE
jgi:hypothetical protein